MDAEQSCNNTRLCFTSPQPFLQSHEIIRRCRGHRAVSQECPLFIRRTELPPELPPETEQCHKISFGAVMRTFTLRSHPTKGGYSTHRKKQHVVRLRTHTTEGTAREGEKLTPDLGKRLRSYSCLIHPYALASCTAESVSQAEKREGGTRRDKGTKVNTPRRRNAAASCQRFANAMVCELKLVSLATSLALPRSDMAACRGHRQLDATLLDSAEQGILFERNLVMPTTHLVPRFRFRLVGNESPLPRGWLSARRGV